MAINVTTSKQQIQASVADDKVTANVSAGFGATGPSGVVSVTAPITNTGTTTSANVGISVGSGLSVSGGSLIVTPDTYATLVDGKVPSGQLPSYVDDVIEVASYGNLPSPGEQGKIYVITGTNRCFRWSGFAWVEIVASPGTTDALPEGNVNLYHTTARAAAAAPVQSVNGQTGAVTITAGSSAWNDITGKPTFATVATSGSYADLTNIPGSFTPSSHTHGSITNDGKVGSAADKVLVTTTAGAVTATSSITFSQVASTSTYTNFSTTPGDLHSSLSGIDSALTGKAASSHAHGNITAAGHITENTPDTDINHVDAVVVMPDGAIASVNDAPTATVHVPVLDVTNGITVGSPGITFSDSSVQTVAWPGSLTYSDVGAAALSHAHSVTADITAGNWKVVYSNGSGAMVELALGASGTVLQSNGTAAAPSFAAVSGESFHPFLLAGM